MWVADISTTPVSPIMMKRMILLMIKKFWNLRRIFAKKFQEQQKLKIQAQEDLVEQEKKVLEEAEEAERKKRVWQEERLLPGDLLCRVCWRGTPSRLRY